MKNLPANAVDLKRLWFDPCVVKIPWKRARQATPVLLPGESHRQRSLASYSPWGRRGRQTEATQHTRVCVRDSSSEAALCLSSHILTTSLKTTEHSLDTGNISKILINAALFLFISNSLIFQLLSFLLSKSSLLCVFTYQFFRKDEGEIFITIFWNIYNLISDCSFLFNK